MEPFTEFAFTVGSATAAVVGLVWVASKAGLPSAYKPALSLLIALSLTVFLSNLPLREAIFSGIMLGLTAAGAYSGTKATSKGIRKMLE